MRVSIRLLAPVAPIASAFGARDHDALRPPDAKNPNKYLDGLNQDELRAITSMSSCFSQEVQVACEGKCDSSSARDAGDKSDAQRQFEARQRAHVASCTKN